ncbi:MAG TPA: T9SS type A sorting domain-containing protein [Cytophagaceae bacterium]|jgi:hypothetical protein|nr:T9SS type A sorting domain-containing protein [Cytophagaceae bacterium]
MKKIILSIAALMTASAAFSQPFTNGTTDYTESFVGTTPSCLATCCATGAYAYADGNIAGASNSATEIRIIIKPTLASGVAPGTFDFMYTHGSGPSAQCHQLSADGFGVDLSDPTKAPQLIVVAKSHVAGTKVQFHLGNRTATNYPNVTTASAGVPTAQTEIALTTSYATYKIDYTSTAWSTGWTTAEQSAVNMWGALIPTTSNAGDTIDIQSIEVLAGTPTATTSANVVNDQVSLYPNPAKGAFNVDMTAMQNTETAAVKVMNANGVVVKQLSTNNTVESITTDGMNKGIYMVQITSGNKIATKKVVVD